MLLAVRQWIVRGSQLCNTSEYAHGVDNAFGKGRGYLAGHRQINIAAI